MPSNMITMILFLSGHQVHLQNAVGSMLDLRDYYCQ